MSERKGATRPVDVPPDILAQLNAGTLETRTLAEGLAIDFRVLLRHVLPDLAPALLEQIRPTDGITRRMDAVGRLLFTYAGAECFAHLAVHPSDTVRGWAAFVLAHIPNLALHERLNRIRSLADDPHFGVREWAWMAMRPHIAADVPVAIDILGTWTNDPSPNIRRFAIESTRPRGVWSAHIAALKHDPALGLPLLEPLKNDESRYVQDSVGNWLNDAAKSQPAWVVAVCRRWQEESPTRATRQICVRALRSVKA